MKNCKVRTNIKIAAWAAAFALAAAVGFGGCTNASDSSGGSGGEPETLKYAVNFNVATEGGEITAALDDGTEINDGDTVEKGKTVTFTAKVTETAPNYLIGGWLQSSEPIIEAGIKSSYSLIITKPTVISVAFEKAQNITIKGDERVEETAVEIPENTSWEVIKSYVVEKLQLKNEWQGDDYGVYEWKLNDENGAAIDDSDSLTAGTTVYVVTNYTKFKTEPVGGDIVLAGYTGEKPRGHIILPSGITKIGYNAFLNCNDLTGQLTVPDGVTKIDAGAFSGCKKLETLILPSTLTYIGGFAFYQCENLKEKLVFPENLTFIGEKAFMGCTKITSITIRSGNVATIKDYAFSLKSSISDILFTVKTGAVKTLLKGSKSGIIDGQITVDSSI
ncbi:leucine-rich repeat domain-containing protein [Treponema sp. Marseille-Q4130]|uniref:leucine-rich repeat domain-containing protein n=1 Tax=Treponema sp. Marseille-Q4130 TaxID=2766702 RepID=UPI00165276B7|nr:leucine-rich repeat domain-containing protein [Treponema sp. Marseille-Q4130]MBC6720835.1 leucine-rich repeat domain-containing protein [Treponema sp. Marseille-Q4130]